MAVEGKRESNARFFRLVIKDKDDQINPGWAEKDPSNNWAIDLDNLNPAISGYIKSFETAHFDHNGKKRYQMKLTMVDPEINETYVLDIPYGAAYRSIILCLAGLDHFDKIRLLVFKGKSKDKTRDTAVMCVYNGDQKEPLRWGYDYEEVIKPLIKVIDKGGGDIEYGYYDLNMFLEKEYMYKLNQIAAVSLKSRNEFPTSPKNSVSEEDLIDREVIDDDDLPF